MGIVIHNLRRQDATKAIDWAIQGMHFYWYVDSHFLLRCYSRYFWYLELDHATRVYGAYSGDQFIGVLLARVDGEPSHGLTLPQRAYTALVGLVLHVCSRDGGGRYEQTLETQYEHYTKTHRPDGEILFLAADPNCGIRGIGTALLSEFEATTHGKRIYLNTDDACTYQFYEHRGYIREEEDRITLRMRKGDVPLTCYIYDKVL